MFQIFFFIKFIFEGVVSSPNFPDNYPYNLRKMDVIVIEEGLFVALQFTAFDVDDDSGASSSNCARHHLEILNGDGTTLMGKTCGYSLPASITSISNIVLLFFSTWHSDSKSGWSVNWSAVPPGAVVTSNVFT